MKYRIKKVKYLDDSLEFIPQFKKWWWPYWIDITNIPMENEGEAKYQIRKAKEAYKSCTPVKVEIIKSCEE